MTMLKLLVNIWNFGLADILYGLLHLVWLSLYLEISNEYNLNERKGCYINSGL